MLDSQQENAAAHDKGPALVIAGPGSGKTATMTHRVARLVARGVEPRRILLLTFTNKAAREMRERACLLDPRCERIMSGTFHAVGLRFIRDRRFAGKRHYQVISPQERAHIVSMLLDELPEKERCALPSPRELAGFFAGSCDFAELERPLSDKDAENRVFALYKKYCEYKRKVFRLDFHDIINFANHLLQTEDYGPRIRRAFDYVCVDEYQDTDSAQNVMLRRLTVEHGNLFAVGDDAQTIYGWRGADHQQIIAFGEDPRVACYRLENNYRSGNHIVTAVNRIHDQLTHRLPKTLQSRTMSDGRFACIRTVSPYRQEGGAMQPCFFQQARQILALISAAPEKCAVLFRSLRAGGNAALQVELRKAGIPFVVCGGPNLLDSAAAHAVMAWMRLLCPVESTDTHRLAWEVIMDSVPYIGESGVRKFRQAWEADKPEDTFAWLQTVFLSRCDKRQREHLSRYLDVYLKLEGIQQPAHVVSIMERMVREEGLRLAGRVERKDASDARGELAILEQMREMSASFLDMESFLTTCALNKVEISSDNTQNALTISTIHGAKGLEWPYVIVADLFAEVYPRKVSGAEYLPPDARQEEIDSYDEERRLFYVAVSRARERCWCIGFDSPFLRYVTAK